MVPGTGLRGVLTRRVGLKCLAGLCLTVAGCGALDEAQAPACPSVQTLAAADNVTKFRDGTGRDLTDVVMEAEIVGFNGFCETDIKERRVDVDLIVTIDALRGPAVREGSTELAYFVSVLDGDGEILRKPVFRTTLEFDGNVGRVRAQEELTLEIPVSPEFVGSDYDILLGFQLTSDERAYNKLQQ